MELSVIPLPREGNGILENINRWRKQLTLPPLEREQLADDAKPTEIAGHKGYLVDITGLGVHTVSRPATAVARRPAPPPRAREQAELPFTYDVPPGWEKDTRPSGLSAVSFTLHEGERRASVTLTPLGGPAGGWAQNINRWRGQVKLPPLGEDELARQGSQLDVAGQPVRYVDIDNPTNPAPDNRILGAILPLQERTWFFKMTGPSELVGRHKSQFESFVKSVKLGGKE
jgi:hypothetical protein